MSGGEKGKGRGRGGVEGGRGTDIEKVAEKMEGRYGYTTTGDE